MDIITRICRDCGKEFSITPAQQQKFLEKDMKLPTRCISCRAKNKHIEYVPCKDCGVPFGMSELEKEWYIKKGFEEPKRCPECRKKRKKENQS